jgi:hypothetical protein
MCDCMKIKNKTQGRKDLARQSRNQKNFTEANEGNEEQEKSCQKCAILGNSTAKTQERAQDSDLHHRGRAELPLCPEFLGGAAAPPYQRGGDSCPGSRKRFPLFALASVRMAPFREDFTTDGHRWTQMKRRALSVSIGVHPWFNSFGYDRIALGLGAFALNPQSPIRNPQSAIP